jgi:DNA-binding NtrC family response regulator
LPCGSETILLVEDDALVRKMTATMLKKLGYTVIVADSPENALSICLDNTHIDLLLTDVVMPEMNGAVLQEKISALLPEIKVLFMSGYTANIIAHHGILEQGVEFISKPFNMQALAEKVRHVVQPVT